ncbi:TetR/AcrR family transcriptional regulator [Mechercharimyces sp. CAU 1602]|uniref:TetR/AcrR family transcriptional regulator n=1 Tax=Mechercharimyces sp. CAU 1602 TaxID=2973933 RepID=UPI002163BEFF|nr:TetR/AcrR family transcriptional regulator [Mechercharimyces sp. CAU 1602]MCS1350397.1 TetR/AcrR family transcriptional regulator [Mechercharimyces sp. CAU 1602]
MNDKKRQIIRSALTLFAQQGFHATSMQEIADQLGIAKGSLYRYFSSKQELLLAIFSYHQQNLFDRMALATQNPSLSAKEKLALQIYVHFEEFHHNHHFMKMSMREKLNTDSKEVSNQLMQTTAKIFSWYKRAIVEIYGDPIVPHLWDAVIMYHSIVKGYGMLLIFEERKLDTKRLAYFIVDRMDEMILAMIKHQPDPILTPTMMMDLESPPCDHPTPEQALHASCGQIKSILCELPLSKSQREEYVAAVDCLYEQLTSNEPQPFLVKAMISFLSEREEIQPQLHVIRSTIT